MELRKIEVEVEAEEFTNKQPPGPRFFVLEDRERLKPMKGLNVIYLVLDKLPKNAAKGCRYGIIVTS